MVLSGMLTITVFAELWHFKFILLTVYHSFCVEVLTVLKLTLHCTGCVNNVASFMPISTEV